MFLALQSILPLVAGLAGPAKAGTALAVFDAGAASQIGADALVCAPIPIGESDWAMSIVPIPDRTSATAIAIVSSALQPDEEVAGLVQGLRPGGVGALPLAAPAKSDRPFPTDPDGGSVPSAGTWTLLALSATIGGRRRRVRS